MHGEPAWNAAAWEPPGRPKRRPGRIIFWGLVGLSIVLVAAGIVLARTQTRTYTIRSDGMAPTLQPGDEMLVTLGPHVRRGDIIVFTRPGGNEQYDKRLIGLPGDHVACCDGGRVTVNGHPLDETYIDRDGPPAQVSFSVTLGPGQMWVLGDHRRDSLDSRGWGPIPTSGIIGYGAIVGRGFPSRPLRTPQTFVADGLAPPDHRVPQTTWYGLLTAAGAVSLLVLAVTGVTRFIIRRRRRRHRPAAIVPGSSGPGN